MQTNELTNVKIELELAITVSRPASGRLGSAMARPGSSVGGGVRGVPGTASRLLETAARCSTGFKQMSNGQELIMILPLPGSDQQVEEALGFRLRLILKC